MASMIVHDSPGWFHIASHMPLRDPPPPPQRRLRAERQHGLGTPRGRADRGARIAALWRCAA
eukprot:7567552-Pyramimonas_sp.AAC.1